MAPPGQAASITLILERRHLVVGAASPGARPGFHFTTFSYSLACCAGHHPGLDLSRTSSMPDPIAHAFAAMENGYYLPCWGRPRRGTSRDHAHSTRCSDAIDRYEHDMERVCQLIRESAVSTCAPNNIFAIRRGPADLACLPGTSCRSKGGRARSGPAPHRAKAAADFASTTTFEIASSRHLASSASRPKGGPESQGLGAGSALPLDG